jgi:hypothetical protein
MALSDEWRQEGESPVRDLEFEAFQAAVAFVGLL